MIHHRNIALFVPHEGCPHCCSFCNQKTISGSSSKPHAKDVDEAIKTALETGGKGGQLAFFGGSFTAIEREYMLELLKAAKKHIDLGNIDSVRISTRPDAINSEIIDILKEYGVSSVELGAQSMDDEVLLMNRRGHTAEDIVRASRMIKEAGIELGLQMMTGLYGDTKEKALRTGERIAALFPDTVRIYPTIVIEGTELARLMKKGEYIPQSIDEAVEICASLLLMFHEKNINVIRCGLHSGGGVEEGYLGGPWHPAFKELCQSRIYLNKALEAVKGEKGKFRLHVKPSALSQMMGQKKSNIAVLREKGIFPEVVPDPTVSEYKVTAEKITEEC